MAAAKATCSTPSLQVLVSPPLLGKPTRLGAGTFSEVWQLPSSPGVAMKFCKARRGWRVSDVQDDAEQEYRAMCECAPDVSPLAFRRIQGDPLYVAVIDMPVFMCDLAKVIRRHPGGLPQADVMAMAVRLLGQLAGMAARGYVHRDIKPGNVLVPAGGPAGACISDFGLASKGREICMGTPDYMAPEVHRAKGAAYSPADVWSLGAVLYESAYGQHPFERRTREEKFRAISDGVEAGRVPEDHPNAVCEGVLRGMLHPDAGRRTTAAGALQEFLSLSRATAT